MAVSMENITSVGRRKTSVARIHMFPNGKGEIIVNKKPFKEYFSDRWDLMDDILSPFAVTGVDNRFTIKINVKGGGKKGQAGAVRLGLSRALAQLDEKTSKTLRANGYLTRDARMVERKKPHKRKARKSEQYKKR